MDWSFLNDSTNLIHLLRNITVAILLQITEQLTEDFFTCQCNEYRNALVWMYFIVPAVAFSTFALSLKRGKIFMNECNCKGCEKTSLLFCKLLYPAVCWVIILLIDGKYLGCALYNRCNDTMASVSNTDPEMIHEIIKSKVIGFSVILAFLLIFVFFLVWHCLQSPAYRYERMYLSQLDKDREELAKEHMKMWSKNRAATFEKSLNEKTDGKPEGESRTTTRVDSTTQAEIRPKTVLDPEEDPGAIVKKIEKAFEYTKCTPQHQLNSPAPSEENGSGSPETSDTAGQSKKSAARSGAEVGADPELGLDAEKEYIPMVKM